jgi:hypothetical protein
MYDWQPETVDLKMWVREEEFHVSNEPNFWSTYVIILRCATSHFFIREVWREQVNTPRWKVFFFFYTDCLQTRLNGDVSIRMHDAYEFNYLLRRRGIRPGLYTYETSLSLHTRTLVNARTLLRAGRLQVHADVRIGTASPWWFQCNA